MVQIFEWAGVSYTFIPGVAHPIRTHGSTMENFQRRAQLPGPRAIRQTWYHQEHSLWQDHAMKPKLSAPLESEVALLERQPPRLGSTHSWFLPSLHARVRHGMRRYPGRSTEIKFLETPLCIKRAGPGKDMRWQTLVGGDSVLALKEGSEKSLPQCAHTKETCACNKDRTSVSSGFLVQICLYSLV